MLFRSEYFSKYYKVLAYDLRGHGQSSVPEEVYSLELFSQDLSSLMIGLKISPAIVCGLSLGGRIGLRFALDYPEMTVSLILADTQSEVYAEGRERFLAIANVAENSGMSIAAEKLYSTPLFEGLSEADSSRFMYERKKTASMSAIGFANSTRAIANMKSMTADMTRVRCPVLVVAGERDLPYVEFLRIFADNIVDCTEKLVPQAGHIANLEQPKKFNTICHEFLRARIDQKGARLK